MDGWIVILHPFQQYFRHISTIGDNERMCAIEPGLRLKRSPPRGGGGGGGGRGGGAGIKDR